MPHLCLVPLKVELFDEAEVAARDEVRGDKAADVHAEEDGAEGSHLGALVLDHVNVLVAPRKVTKLGQATRLRARWRQHAAVGQGYCAHEDSCGGRVAFKTAAGCAPAEPQINMSAWVLCMSWCAEWEFWVTHGSATRQVHRPVRVDQQRCYRKGLLHPAQELVHAPPAGCS